MLTQKTTKGLQGVTENPCSSSVSRQASSLYNLTLDEVQTNLGKPLGSMNLDELVRTIWTAEAATDLPSGSWSPLTNNRQSSFSVSQDLSKKTVEEVWREIGQGKKDSRNVGEMTLESFLNQAGVIVDSNNVGSGSNAEWNQYQILPQQQHQPRREMPVFMPSLDLLPANGDSTYLDISMSPSNMMMSDTQSLGRKRTAAGEIVEKTVERRQKRMIKNRESAARSRARKQAYTQELEIKIAKLEEENERLTRTRKVENVLPTAPPPEAKYQLRRTSSSPF